MALWGGGGGGGQSEFGEGTMNWGGGGGGGILVSEIRDHT